MRRTGWGNERAATSCRDFRKAGDAEEIGGALCAREGRQDSKAEIAATMTHRRAGRGFFHTLLTWIFHLRTKSPGHSGLAAPFSRKSAASADGRVLVRLFSRSQWRDAAIHTASRFLAAS